MQTAIVALDAPAHDGSTPPTASAIVDTLWLAVLGSDGVEHIHAAPCPRGVDTLFYLASDAHPDTALKVCLRTIAGAPWLTGWTASLESASPAW